MRRLLLAAIAASTSALAAAPGALAATTCTGRIGGHISGPLNVPAHHTCKLAAHAIVEGSTTVEGALVATRSDTFDGGIKASHAGTVDVATSSVAGAIKLTDGHGEIQLRGDTLERGVSITGTHARVVIAGDTFISSLSCTRNVPEPVDAAASTIEGRASGQCAGFRNPG